MKRPSSQTLFAIGLGAGLGYVAAFGHLDRSRSALAASEPRSPSAGTSALTEGTASCSERATRSNLLALATTAVLPGSTAAAQSGKKPNIVIIWGDDIGQSNISAYSMGTMGYRTPNIDRVAKEGMIFTDYYAEQSCTAGRASFITGQHGLRTGMTKFGLPGSALGLQKQDPTIAELLKPHGYATGQFGKNHLGDRNEFLPTVHGFDEFYSNFYCNDDQQVTGLRFDNWKMVFMEQRARGTLLIWAEPFTTLRVPKIFNLRTDPYERADITSNTYYDWLLDHVFLLVPAQDYVGNFLMTFKDFPQRQKAASFNLDEVMSKLNEGGGIK